MNEIGDDNILKWNPRIKPLFWMDETTGMMRHIVEKLFEKIHLTHLELKYLRWYIIQWIDGIVEHTKKRYPEKDFEVYMKNGVPKDYKTKMNDMDQKQIMDYIGNELSNYGIDPF